MFRFVVVFYSERNAIMLLHTLGTSSGTAPVPGKQHTCLALETQNNLYFFDAGENGAYTASVNGVDLLKTRAIFITHSHMDHVGGLGNMLWYIRKISLRDKVSLAGRVIDIFTPCLETVQGFMTVLSHTEHDFVCEHKHEIHQVEDGLLYSDDDIKVSAIHSHHMPERNGKPTSFGYIIECEGKKIVYTGDMRLEDLEYLVPSDCDVLLAETGHHVIEQVCDALKKYNKNPKMLIIVHQNTKVSRDMNKSRLILKENFSGCGIVADDGGKYIL